MRWRKIPSFPTYEASERGDIRHVTVRKIKSQHVAKRGYLCVGLYHEGKGRTQCVHRLVCEAFRGRPRKPRMDAAHRDGHKFNNKEDNLRWATRKQNEADKVLHGRSNRGERNGQAKITDAQAADLRRKAALLPRSSGGKRIKKGALGPLARSYGLSKAAAANIIAGRRRIH